MRFMCKLLYLFIVVTMALSCESKPDAVAEHKITSKTERLHIDSITESGAKKYDLEKAQKAFGIPLFEEDFTVDDALPEFRIGIYNFIKPSEYQKNKIKIKEKTWSKDPVTNLTVWYKFKNKNWQPVDVYIWPKGAEF